jgi:GrpB-like predicted nucleotidyltransferase (UPF0157 family)
MIWKFELRDYEAAWADRYAIAISELKGLLPMALAFEHVGGTSIQTIAAVPTIDILAGVLDLSAITDAAIRLLVAEGWEHRPDVEKMIPGWRFFNKPPGPEHRTTRTHHLHMVQYQAEEWWKPIQFRDYLREHAEVAREYEGLKRTLASREYENPSDYSAQKADIVAYILGLAARRGCSGQFNR